jgi:hypothetical protein
MYRGRQPDGDAAGVVAICRHRPQLYGRPDLNPDEMPLSAVPQDIATLDCPLWADATVQKRGITVLGTLPHVSHGADIPLGQPRALPAN